MENAGFQKRKKKPPKIIETSFYFRCPNEQLTRVELLKKGLSFL